MSESDLSWLAGLLEGEGMSGQGIIKSSGSLIFGIAVPLT